MKPLTIASIGINLVLAWMIYSYLTGSQSQSPAPVQLASDDIEIWDVVRVSDADTIAVRQGSEERRIRFCGIDAPESSQPGGKEATEFLKNAIAQDGGQVGLTFVEVDRYGRWIAEVWSSPGTQESQLFNSLLIDIGHAWPYKQYWGNCPNRSALAASEKSAEQSGRGIWMQPGAIAPWDWRRQKP